MARPGRLGNAAVRCRPHFSRRPATRLRARSLWLPTTGGPGATFLAAVLASTATRLQGPGGRGRGVRQMVRPTLFLSGNAPPSEVQMKTPVTGRLLQMQAARVPLPGPLVLSCAPACRPQGRAGWGASLSADGRTLRARSTGWRGCLLDGPTPQPTHRARAAKGGRGSGRSRQRFRARRAGLRRRRPTPDDQARRARPSWPPARELRPPRPCGRPRCRGGSRCPGTS